jgi:manganese oxidase
MRIALRALAVFALLSLGSAAFAQDHQGITRTYYIAADEIDWNYIPSGRDLMMGGAPAGYAKMYVQHAPGYIGPVYRKAVYREYTDATFTHLKPRAKSDAYLGTVGPVIYAEVGDTIKVVFCNHGTHPYSMHPHGVLYDEMSEGAVSMRHMMGAVAPGKTFTYTWQVPERAGPGPNDPSSIVWLYHSHVNERRDVNTGLIGAIVVTRQGMARPDGTPKDVDRNLVALYMEYDENQSWFINDNIKRFVKKTKGFRKSQSVPFDSAGNFDALVGTGFAIANFRFTINGYQYANMPVPRMRKGEHVRWYLLTLGEGFNFHTPHWHGNTVLVGGQRTDVVNLGPASMITADMVPDNVGTWLFHCHVSDHMDSGMVAEYQVLP